MIERGSGGGGGAAGGVNEIWQGTRTLARFKPVNPR